MNAPDLSQPRSIKAIALDVFGTLAEITDKRRPYSKLAQTCARPQNIGRIAMTQNLGLVGIAHQERSTLSISELAALEQELYAELASVRLFPETEPVLRHLRAYGYKLALISNLAAPYAVPIKLLLPFKLDAYAWSFERGALKPDREIYDWTAERLACRTGEILMVGDTYKADYAGAAALGFQALHLDRSAVSEQADPAVIHDLTGILKYLGLED